MNIPLLSVENLSVNFNNQQTVVDDISFVINSGETFSLVGESGSGKSITALSVLRLLPNNAQIKAHAINLQDDNLIKRTEFELCSIRGRRIGFIFQDPMSSLNPVMTIGSQIEEVIKIHFLYQKQLEKIGYWNYYSKSKYPNRNYELKTTPINFLVDKGNES